MRPTYSDIIPADFWSQAERDDHGCLLWTGGTTHYGYGRHRQLLAHRVAFYLAHGRVPDWGKGLCIDHVCHDPHVCHDGLECRHRRCVEPAHLQEVAKTVNDDRGGFFSANPRNGLGERTHCSAGHEFTPDNTRWKRPAAPYRVCRTCLKAAGKPMKTTTKK